MPKAKKLVIDEGLINSCLPDVPKGYNRRIEQQSARIWRVVLDHEREYSFKQGEIVTTVWGFIKGDKVHRPSTMDKPAREVLCHILDASELPRYTSIIPTCTDLTHIK